MKVDNSKKVMSIMIMMQTKMLKIGITITPHIHILYKKKLAFLLRTFLTLSSTVLAVTWDDAAVAALMIAFVTFGYFFFLPHFLP